jgi:6-methylsalicylate decarboxylase
MVTRRIDVHTHLVPPFWESELKTHGGDPSGWGSPAWSPESALRFMDEEEIALSVLSLTAPGVDGWKGDDRLDITRRVNDYGAALVQRHPDRFGYFATLALPDVDAALGEIARAYDELHVDGIVLHSNFDGIYPGDPRFDRVWEELETRSATVFIHPATPPMPIVPGVPGPLSDYPAETTRCALDLVLKGHRKRFASTSVILSHGGGFLPYVSSRFAELSASLANDRSAEQLKAEMQSFYFDTALVAPSGLPSLLAFAPLDHIVFGTDFPYASEKVSKTFTDNLDRASGLTVEQLETINSGATRLFARLQRI